MNHRLRSSVIGSIAALALLVSGPASGAEVEATIGSANTFESCFSGTPGACSTNAVAGPSGAFSASATLTSFDSPLSRGTRYSMALARYTIVFDLDEPTTEAEIRVALDIDEASASWTHDVPEVFGGETNGGSGAKVLLQLLGHGAPSNCGCGFFIQGSPDVVVARAASPGEAQSVEGAQAEVVMTARNPFGDNLLPAGRYEVLLRLYALADLIGSGDWGTLEADLGGTIQEITVTTTGGGDPVDPDDPAGSVLMLSVSGSGSNRTLAADLTDVDGAPIGGRAVSFYGDGDFIGTTVTDGNGVATMSVEGKLRGGSRLFRAEFAGDEVYEAASAEARS